MTIRRKQLYLFVVSTVFPFMAMADGVLSGKVFDDATKSSLGGAKIEVAEKGISSTTEKDGIYTLKLEDGKYTLNVTYIGYQNKSVEIEIQGADKNLDIDLKSNVSEMPGMTIMGARQGQMKALNQKKSSGNFVEIVSSDLMGKFPDNNPAEAIGRMPGVVLNRDGGEGRMVRIRGGEERMATASINGSQIPGAETHTRTSQLDVISLGMFDQVELQKTFTPDNDMDAITGRLELRPKAVADEPVRTINLGTGLHFGALKKNYGMWFVKDMTHDPVPGFPGGAWSGGASISQRFLDKKLGLFLSITGDNYNQGYNSSDFTYVFGLTPADSSANNLVRASRARFYDYAVTRSRFSGNLGLDYKFDKNNSISLHGIFSQFNDYEWYKSMQLSSISWKTQDSSTARLTRVSKDRYEFQQNIWASLGTEHKDLFNVMNFDWSINYSEANEREPDREDCYWEYKDSTGKWINAGVKWDVSEDFSTPVNVSTKDKKDAQLDYKNFRFSKLNTDNDTTYDRDFVGNANFEFPISLSSGSLKLKAGVKGKYKTKYVKDSLRTWEWKGSSPVPTLDQYIAPDDKYSYNSDTYMFGDNDASYINGNGASDQLMVRDLYFSNNTNGNLVSNQSLYETRSLPNNYKATEKVVAGYFMGTLDIGKFELIGGLRVERTSYVYDAYKLNTANYQVGSYQKVTQYGNYIIPLPSLSLKFDINDNIVTRAGISRTYSRAEYAWIKPTVVENQTTGTLSWGNPDLTPTKSINGDISLEVYNKSGGLLSFGGFYKNISDFMYQRTWISDGILNTKYVNGDKAYLIGAEVNLMQQFTMLPGALNGLGLMANFTTTGSKAEVFTEKRDNPYTDTSSTAYKNYELNPKYDSRESAFPGQSPFYGNVSLSYEKFGFMARIAANFSTSHVISFGASEEEDNWVGKDFRLDVNLSQKFGKNKNMVLALDLINLTNEPEDNFFKIDGKEYTNFAEFYSPWTRLSFTYKF